MISTDCPANILLDPDFLVDGVLIVGLDVVVVVALDTVVVLDTVVLDTVVVCPDVGDIVVVV